MRTFAVSLLTLILQAALALGLGAAEPAGAAFAPLVWHARARVEKEKGSGRFEIVSRELRWNPRETAVVVCDMWDQHWCAGATRRVADLAPRMNETIQAARRRGMLILHCPSDTMEFYKETPQRKLAQQAPAVETKVPLQRWCRLDPEREPALPIDDSDGGCDTAQPDKPSHPWKRQIAAIEIGPDDAVTDSAEAYYLMRQRGIRNVIVMGVHANMCVLGRSFSIRQMVYQGMNVVVMRDHVDAMYNPARAPFVPHHRGTEMVVEHIEKYWCPSVVSTDLTGRPPFRFADDARPHVVFLINEQEYQPTQTIPPFAQELQDRFHYSVEVITAQKGRGFVGAETLERADLVVLFARREPLSPAQQAGIRKHLEAGKPLLGLRTASHAFGARGTLPAGLIAWDTIDPEVFGGSYRGHGPQGSRIRVAGDGAAALLAGIDPPEWTSSGSLYYVSPIDAAATVLLTGTDQTNAKPEPVAWTRTAGKARVFYTSLGHADDFAQPQFRRLLVNAVQWCLGEKAAAERTSRP